MYSFILNTLFGLGLKKTAVKLANKWGGDVSTGYLQRYNAAWELITKQAVYPRCISCQWAVIPGDPHEECERQLGLRRCQEPGCWEDATQDGYCQIHWEDHNLCNWCGENIKHCICGVEDPDDAFLDEEEDEDPLAGDVDPTGGYYEPQPDPFEAQRLNVMRQHGDYTGW